MAGKMRSMIKFTTCSAAETRALGENFGKRLQGGEVLALSGNLGGGKTVFTRGLAVGLRIKKNVTSPTFAVLHPYPKAGPRKNLTLYHFDLYRLKSPSELVGLGWTEVLADQHGIVVVEWPEKAKKLLPKKALRIKFTLSKQPNERIVEIS